MPPTSSQSRRRPIDMNSSSEDDGDDDDVLTYNPFDKKYRKSPHGLSQSQSQSQSQSPTGSTGDTTLDSPGNNSNSNSNSNKETKNVNNKRPIDDQNDKNDDHGKNDQDKQDELEGKARAHVAALPHMAKLWAQQAKYKIQNLKWHFKPTKHGKQVECFPCRLLPPNGFEAHFMTKAARKQGKVPVAYLMDPPEQDSVTPSQLISMLDENQQIPPQHMQAFLHTLERSKKKKYTKSSFQLLLGKYHLEKMVQLCLQHEQQQQLLALETQQQQQQKQQNGQPVPSELDLSSEGDDDHDDERDPPTQQQQRCSRNQEMDPVTITTFNTVKKQRLRAGCIIEWYPPNDIPQPNINLRRSKVTKVTTSRKAKTSNVHFVIEMDHAGGIPGLRLEDQAKMVQRMHYKKLEPNPNPQWMSLSEYHLVKSQEKTTTTQCCIQTTAAAFTKVMEYHDQQLLLERNKSNNKDLAFVANQLRSRPHTRQQKSTGRNKQRKFLPAAWKDGVE